MALTEESPNSTPAAELRVDIQLYGAEPVFQAAYKFTDRCYLFLRRDGVDHLVVEFRPKSQATPIADVVGDFSNELIDQHLRASIAEETRGIRQRLYEQAFGEASLIEDGD